MSTLVSVLVIACGGSAGNSARAVIQNKGSDTLITVAQAWAEAYSTVDGEVAVAVSGGGSGTGISAMINGTVDIANSSRRMTDREIDAARANGNHPVEHLVGHDALAVYVHADNPVDQFTLQQLAGIYGASGPLERWSQLGVTIPGCTSDEIVRVSRQNNSGTFAYFREAVLENQDFKLGSHDMHGSKDVVHLVAQTPCAIGYSGMAYAIPEVRMPCVMDGNGDPCVAPSMESALDGSYPISRPLLMYTSGDPAGEVKAYLDWVLGEPGQCIMLELGYTPAIPARCVE
jgi:phosphate transport system substrate-binding protein